MTARLFVSSAAAAVALVALLPAPARADEPHGSATATLATPSAPAPASSPAASPAAAPTSSPSAASTADAPAPLPMQTEHLVAFRFLAGAAGAIVSVPATLALGSVLGNSLTGNLAGSLILAAVPFAVLVPVAVVGAEAIVGERLAPGSSRFSPAIWFAGLANLGMIVAGHFAGVAPVSLDFRSVALFTLVEALVLPTVVTVTMHFTAARPRTARAPATPRRASVRVRPAAMTPGARAEAAAAWAGASARAAEGLRAGDPALAASAPFTVSVLSTTF